MNYLGIFFEFYIRRRVGTKRNDNFYFLPFSSSFNLWWLEMEPSWYFVNFFEFFCYFFWIFYYALGRNEAERQYLFSLFLVLFRTILASNQAKIRFFNFLNFFAIFLEFSITRRVGTKQNDNFYFLSFSTFSNLFWLEIKKKWYFLIFWIIWEFFLNFILDVG